MKMELIEGSETSDISIVTPGNYPKENILHTGHGESLKSRITSYIIKTQISQLIANCINLVWLGHMKEIEMDGACGIQGFDGEPLGAECTSKTQTKMGES